MTQTEWFESDVEERELPGKISQALEMIEHTSAWVAENQTLLYRIYTNSQVMDLAPEVANNNLIVREGTDDDASTLLNVTATVVDTLLNRLCSSQIKPMILSDGSRWILKKTTKNTEKFSLGVMFAEDFWGKAREVALDALVGNIGFLNIYCDDDKIRLERIDPREMKYDERTNGHPREVYRVKYVPVYELKEEFPEHAEALSTHGVHVGINPSDRPTNVIKVRECWHLGCDDLPGRHSITTEQLTLVDEEYKHEDYPFVVFRWKRRPNHYTGLGIAEELFPLHKEIQGVFMRIRKNHALHGNPKVFADVRSNVNMDELTDEFGTVISYDSATGGQAPNLAINAAIHPEFYNWLSTLRDLIYEGTGVNQLSSQGVNPNDINRISGYAMEMFEQYQTKRFTISEIAWQNFAVDVAKKILQVAKDNFGSRPVKTQFVAREFVETIDWSQVNSDFDSFRVTYHPTSLLPETGPGRLNVAQKLLESGLATPEEIKPELFYPEMKRYMDNESVLLDTIYEVVDAMLYEDKYIAPTKYYVSPMAIKIVTSEFLRAQKDGAPEDVLANLSKWLDEADALQSDIMRQEMEKQMEMQQMMQPPPAPQEQLPQQAPEQGGMNG